MRSELSDQHSKADGDIKMNLPVHARMMPT